ncbi:MAG: LamG domain-containing protein, partial [Phycisphaerales bacterium]
MSNRLISLASIVDVSNLEVRKTYCIYSAGKASLFRDFVLAVFLLIASSLLTAMPAAYGEDAYALEVNGASLTIDDDEDILRLSSYTYEFWMKDLQGPTGSWRNIFCKGPGDTNAGRGPLLALRPDDPGLHFSHSTGSGQETANVTEGIAVNVWTHIALVLTALDGEQIIYINGVEVVAEEVSSLTDTTQTAVLRMGIGANVVLDDFRIWDYARTQEEIQADMNFEATGVEEGLVGYWRFNEGQGTTAHDLSAYENHGNITSPVWTTDTAPIEPGKPPVVASRPSPANGELYTNTWATLTWRPGDFAVSHDVYMGDNFDDVNNGAAHTFLGNVASAMQIVGFTGYPYPEGLVPGTTYYWRIDGINDANPDSPWKGPVWSFWIPSTKAYAPSPSDGAQYVDIETTLTWEPGHDAKLHNIVFGDSYDEVSNAPAGSPVTTTSFMPGTLEKGKTYYWRVDEFNPPTTVKGDVWSFSTLLDIPITDPNLVGWWKFDDDTGTTAVDASGHDNYGTLKGDPEWAIGYDGSALSFDGVDDFVEVPHAEILTVDNEVTVMAWILTSRHGGPGTQGYQGIVAKGNPPRSYSLYTQSAGTLHFSTTSAGAYVGSSSSEQVPLNEWVHVAAMVSNGEHLYYINGEPAGTGGSGIELPGMADTATVVIARTHEGATRSFLGMIDDVRIYNRALTQDEIKLVMRGDTKRAWNPSPANGELAAVNVATTLTWSAGDDASQHDVYFGMDKAAVAGADASDTTGVYRGRQNATSYTPEGITMDSGPFYWRIDGVANDGSIVEGGIWTFSVANYVLVDDFESYNDIPAGEPGSNLVYVVWIDGFDNPNVNGSTMGYVTGASMETGNVHGGDKSVPLQFDNTTAGVSEVVRTFTPAQDWTAHGAITLSLWFAGDATNVPGQLYVKVNGVQVNYDGDASNLTRTPWQVWNIDLTAINTNLSRVTSLAIGIQGPGATGTLLLDDIRLYAQGRELVTPV